MTTDRPLGVVLAGGLARRMGGGDKARLRIGGRTILERVLEGFQPQCAALIVNANGDPARFSDTGLAIVADSIPDFAGPLAGILAALDWAAAHSPELADVVSVPGDCPFLPHDLVAQLLSARAAARTPLACARSGDQRHPPWSPCGRSMCGTICAGRWWRKGCARSKPLPRVTGWRSRTGRCGRSTHSSMSTRRTMPPRPNALRRCVAALEAVTHIRA